MHVYSLPLRACPSHSSLVQSLNFSTIFCSFHDPALAPCVPASHVGLLLGPHRHVYPRSQPLQQQTHMDIWALAARLHYVLAPASPDAIAAWPTPHADQSQQLPQLQHARPVVQESESAYKSFWVRCFMFYVFCSLSLTRCYFLLFPYRLQQPQPQPTMDSNV